MSRMFLLHFADGTVCRRSLREGLEIEDDLKKHPHRSGEPVRVVEADDAARKHDRRWRECWTLDGDRIVVDLPKARLQRLEEIRRERAALWTEHDVAWKRAWGAHIVAKPGPDKDNAEVELMELERDAEILRNAPTLLAPELAAASTPDEVAAVGLEQLRLLVPRS